VAEAAHQIEAKVVYLPKAALAIGSSRWTSHMNPDLFYAFTIAFVGAALFLFVDKYERKGPVAPSTQIFGAVLGWRGDRAQIAAALRH
jgi:hypothetical protein